jgi:glycosyltransferase involved in cell wall biosynthesis
MTNLVDETCGFALEPAGSAKIVKQVADLLLEAAKNRERLHSLSLAAREKIEKSFTWECRINQFQKILAREGLLQ